MLISKDENIKTSSVYVGSLILKLFQKKGVDKLSIFEIAEYLKKHKIIHYRQMFFGLALLYSSSVIEFEEPFVSLVSDNWQRGLSNNNKVINQATLFDY